MNCIADHCVPPCDHISPYLQTCSPPIGVVVLANKADRIGEEGVRTLLAIFKYLQYIQIVYGTDTIIRACTSVTSVTSSFTLLVVRAQQCILRVLKVVQRVVAAADCMLTSTLCNAMKCNAMQVNFHKSQLEKLCKKCHVDAWFATSAKSGANVELAIKEVVRLALTGPYSSNFQVSFRYYYCIYSYAASGCAPPASVYACCYIA
jgi:hypothetical protein